MTDLREMTDMICINSTGLIDRRGVTALCGRIVPTDLVMASMSSPLGDTVGGLNEWK